MDAEIKAKWTAKLRSGEIKQGRFSLRNSEGAMCCLGVLAEVCGASWRDGRTPFLPDGTVLRRANGDEYLSAKFAEPLGLIADAQCELAKMNDAEKTFSEIADYIDAKL